MSEYQRQTYIGALRTSKDEGQYHGFVVGKPVATPYDGEYGTDSREVVQNTETHGALKRQGLPADALKPAWKPVLDAARGFVRQLDAYADKDGEHLTGKQKQVARNTVGKVVNEIIGGK